MGKGIKTVNLVVGESEYPSPDVKRLVLRDEDGWELPPFQAGAHLDLHLRKGLVRTYSLCNDPSDNHRYVVAIKLEAEGRGGSRHIHESVEIGDRIGVSLPRGAMDISPLGMNIFIAGGIGVTPFLSVIHAMEAAGQTNYRLHWASRGDATLIDMVQPALAAGRVRLYDTLREPHPDIPSILAEAGSEGRAFCCGPDSMLDAFEATTQDWPESRKHVERFNAPSLVFDANATPYELVLSQSQKSIIVTPELGLVGALEELDADVSISCAGGICGACRTRWIEGPPIHRDRVLTPEERTREVIVCVANCTAPRLVLDL